MEILGRFRINVLFVVLVTFTVLFGLSGQVHAFYYGDYSYMYKGDGIEITGYVGSGGNITIPSTIDGLTVTSIGDNAFENCRGINSVTVPSGVTNIGNKAFNYCVNLTDIILPKVSGLKTIGNCAFYYCLKLTNCKLPDGLIIIGESAFSACASLPTISIPSSVNTIGKYAFASCDSLKSISIPQGISSIAEGLFWHDDCLTNVSLPIGLKSIGNQAFFKCVSLTNIYIPEGVTNIGASSFFSCIKLSSVDIPESVTFMGIDVFMQCTGLARINFYSSSVYFDSGYGSVISSPYTIPDQTIIFGYDPSTAKVYADTHGKKFQNFNTESSSNISKTAIYEAFNYNPNEFNQTLAERSAIFSMLAYDNYACSNISLSQGYRDTGLRLPNPDPVLLKTELNFEKFDNIETYNYGDNNPDNDSFVLAHKKIWYNNKQMELTAVIIRGTDGVEWQGDMDVTGDSYNMNHWSFEKGKVDVKNQLIQYLSDYHISNTVLLVTGHSRGAAVANLLANDLTNNDSTDGIGDVFAYTFATPNVTLTPDYNKTNILNFCFEDDFVPQVPLDAWGYRKNGITYRAVAQDSYRKNSGFTKEMNEFVHNSNPSHDDARFDYNATKSTLKYIGSRWNSTFSYYYFPVLSTNPIFFASNLHEYMRNSVGAAAADGNLLNAGKFLANGNAYPMYGPVMWFFLDGNSFKLNIIDNHQMFSYYSALKNGVFKTNGMIPEFAVSDDIGFVEVNSISTQSTSAPSNANGAEVQKLKDFAAQGDNLSKLAWNLDDVSTWSGVLWSDETENRVVSLDLKFKDLTGTLDLSGFSSLEVVDVSGNSLSAISLTGCNALTGLNCAYNQLTQLDLTNTSGIRTLNCNGNQLQTLNLSGCTALEEFDCSSNQLADLNVSANTTLTSLYCRNNNLTSLDLTANTLLTDFDCEGNYLDVQEGSDMYGRIQTVLGMDGGWVSYEYQKIRENAAFNSDDMAKLSEFANQGDNLSKLQWDLGKPSEWFGVEWTMVGTEYRVGRLTLDNLNLTGSLNVSAMAALSSLSCNNNQLTSINAASCEKLGYLSCYNTGINELNINGCGALYSLECSNNYLDLSAGTQLKDNIETIRLKEGSVVSCDPQKIAASKDQFNAEEVSILLTFAGNDGNSELLNWNADKPGEWAGVSWEKINGEYRVTALNFNTRAVTGSLNLSNFGWLTNLDCSLSKITAIQLPSNMTTIDANTFYNCDALTDVTFPESLTVIGDEAFYNCSALKDIKLPDSVTSIGEGAFAGCKNLTTMDIPLNTVSLGNYGFYECTGLSTVQFSSGAILIGDDPSTIPETAKIIGYDPSTAKDYAVKYGRTFEAIAADTKLGDVDGNGSITAYDALMALQIATGKKQGTTEELKAADVDKSGSVQAFDALRILQYATGKITSF